MLSAFQSQLDYLSQTDIEKFEQKIKERWTTNVPNAYIKEMKEFISLLPKVEKAIFDLYVWLPEGSNVKKAGEHFLTYMYEPHDFIPENESNGLFGYLDDAYIAALFYELLIEEVSETHEYRLRKKDKELVRKVGSLRKKAKKTIAAEAKKIHQMLAEIFRDEATIYNSLFGRKKATIV